MLGPPVNQIMIVGVLEPPSIEYIYHSIGSWACTDRQKITGSATFKHARVSQTFGRQYHHLPKFGSQSFGKKLDETPLIYIGSREAIHSVAPRSSFARFYLKMMPCLLQLV